MTATKIRLPNVTDALRTLVHPRIRGADAPVAQRLMYAKAFARAHLELDEIPLPELLELARFIDECLDADAAVTADDIADQLPTDISPDDLFFLYQGCSDPDCTVHGVDKISDAELRQALLRVLKTNEQQLPPTYYDRALRLLGDPGTKFKRYPNGVLLTHSTPDSGMN